MWVEAVVYGAIIGFVIGFAAASIQAAVNGASAGQALKAGAISGAIGGALGAGFGFLGWAAAGSANATLALNAFAVASGSYGAYQSASTGQWVGFSLSILAIAVGLYGLARPSGPNPTGQGANGSRGLTDAEIGEYSPFFEGRDLPEDFWSNITLDGSTGVGDRPFTWRWPWSRNVSLHLGSDYSASSIPAGTEAGATLVHELAHAIDFRQNWLGTAFGALKDQVAFLLGSTSGYNPSLRGGSYSVEQSATPYEWSYRTTYGVAFPTDVPSNFPSTAADLARLRTVLPR
jgi:hypothetical protein